MIKTAGLHDWRKWEYPQGVQYREPTAWAPLICDAQAFCVSGIRWETARPNATPGEIADGRLNRLKFLPPKGVELGRSGTGMEDDYASTGSGTEKQ